jgi:dolichol-phosphate mannosyltransferase
MTSNEKILIILPTYNEKENLENAVGRIFEVDSSIHVLVVDDNSPDGTGQLAEKLKSNDPRVHVLHRPRKEGLGRAYLEGFQYALSKDYEYIFEMDADLSHDPKYIPDFLLAAREADVVIGSRYLTGVNVINWPMSRLLLSYTASLYVRLITGLPIKDPTGGFKCFRRRALLGLNLARISSSGYSFQIEVSYKCWKKGFVLREIPIIFTDRKLGRSKMSTGIFREAVVLLWKLRLRTLLRGSVD